MMLDIHVANKSAIAKNAFSWLEYLQAFSNPFAASLFLLLSCESDIRRTQRPATLGNDRTSGQRSENLVRRRPRDRFRPQPDRDEIRHPRTAGVERSKPSGRIRLPELRVAGSGRASFLRRILRKWSKSGGIRGHGPHDRSRVFRGTFGRRFVGAKRRMARPPRPPRGADAAA